MSDWDKLDKVAKRKQMSELLTSIDWEAVGIFLLCVIGIISVVVVSFFIKQHDDLANTNNRLVKTSRIESCKTATNVDACLAIVNR